VKAFVGFFHGLIWMAFVAMTVIITRPFGWSGSTPQWWC